MYTLIKKGQTIGVEEIIQKIPKRQFSMQIASKSCRYLYLSVRHFREKFFSQCLAMKQDLCQKITSQDLLIKQLEECKKAYKTEDGHPSLPRPAPNNFSTREYENKNRMDRYRINFNLGTVKAMFKGGD